MSVQSRRVLAFVNRKGGSGKTSSTVSVAACLAELGYRPLIIDLDAQATTSRWISTGPAAGIETIYLEQADLEPLIVESLIKGVDLVRASDLLTERRLAMEPLSAAALKGAIEELEGPWDWILLDTPPALGNVTVSALAAATDAVITVEASFAAVHGMPDIIKAVQGIGKRLPPGPRLLGVVVCRADTRQNVASEVIAAVERALGDLAFETVIRDRVTMREAIGAKQAITSYDPAGHATTDYRSLTQEILGR